MLEGAVELFREKAAATHPGVEGEVRLHRLVFSEGIEVVNFLKGTKAGGPVARRNFFTLGRKGGPKNVRAGADSGFVEAARFPGIGHAEVGEIFGIEGAGDFEEPVTVCPGLDHGHDFLARTLTGDAQVVAECGEVNFGPGAWRRLSHGCELRGRGEGKTTKKTKKTKEGWKGVTAPSPWAGPGLRDAAGISPAAEFRRGLLGGG